MRTDESCRKDLVRVSKTKSSGNFHHRATIGLKTGLKHSQAYFERLAIRGFPAMQFVEFVQLEFIWNL